MKNKIMKRAIVYTIASSMLTTSASAAGLGEPLTVYVEESTDSESTEDISIDSKSAEDVSVDSESAEDISVDSTSPDVEDDISVSGDR